MGCLTFLIKIIFFLWIIQFLWKLIAPLFAPSEETQKARAATARIHFLQLLMPILAKIAKLDGRVSEDEISSIERIFQELKLSPEEQRTAQAAFNQAKDDSETLQEKAAAFAMQCSDPELRFLTFQFMLRVASAGGGLTENDLRALRAAAFALRLPAPLIEMLLASATGRRTRNDFAHAAPNQRKSDLALLGLPETATSAEIKTAYRQKVKELHPDKLQAKGLPEVMLKQATERLAAINAAYKRLTS